MAMILKLRMIEQQSKINGGSARIYLIFLSLYL
jgi:hypothetical protein